MKVAIDFIKRHRFWFKLAALFIAGLIVTLLVLRYIERRDKSAFERGQAQEAALRNELQDEVKARERVIEKLMSERAALEAREALLREEVKKDKEEIARLQNEEADEKKRASVERSYIINIPGSLLRCRVCAEFRAVGRTLPEYCRECP